jgi:mannose-6-phosphate isomerase
MKPLALAPNNVTPASRTPWGGTKLTEFYGKSPASDSAVVGESWEVSVASAFPSLIRDTQVTLRETVEADPEGWLGKQAAQHASRPHLLTKLLDSSQALSVQVHPPLYPRSGKGGGGKFETWIILAREDGAGIYLGFKPGVTAKDILGLIREEGNVAETLNFIEVEPGDVFHVRPGTPHAIGAGVTLFEPQAIHPDSSGITYRCWDWNRRFDEHGVESPDGEPREIHLNKFIEVTDWHRVTSKSLVHTCREQPNRSVIGDVTIENVSGSPWYEIDRVRGGGRVRKFTDDRFVAVTCLSGEVTVSTEDGSVKLSGGNSAVIPAAAEHYELVLEDADLFVVKDTSW